MRSDSDQKFSKRRIHEHFVCRAAGLPNRPMEDLRASGTLQELRRLETVAERRNRLAEELEQRLFRLVDGEQDRDIRRALLALKRDVHNGRGLKKKALDGAASALGDDLRADLAAYDGLIKDHRQGLDVARRLLAEETPEIRRRFQDAVTDDDFTKGLLLSSRSLTDQVERYRRASPSSIGAKARQIERSLMRYYSRMALKATPFSTFCSLLPGRLITASPQTPPAFIGDPAQKTSALRLNKTLFVHILRALYGRPEIRRRLPLELNPTLDAELDDDGKERWVFLSARGRQEIFQRLPAHPVVALLVDALRTDGPRPLQDLAALLQKHPDIEAEDAEALAYVDRLIEIGLFRFRLGIPEQEVDWDRPLSRLLQGLDDPLADRMIELLATLRGHVEAYGPADPAARRRLLEQAETLVGDTIQALGGNAGAAPQGSGSTSPDVAPFYEDAGGDAHLELDLGELEPLLLEYVELTSRLAWPRSEQANMAHFFKDFYGTDGEPVPLLRFYEDYFRHHFKAHVEAQRRREPPRGVVRPNKPPTAQPTDGEKPEHGEAGEATPEDGGREVAYDVQNPFGLEFVQALDEGNHRLTRRIQELWQADPEAEELVLRRADLEAAVGALPPLEGSGDGRRAPLSVSLFAQYVHGLRADGSSALVARTYLTGFGKYFSRFLYLMPDEVQDDLRRNNEALTDHVPAEICGDANFNANLHPPLLPKELSYPTGQSGEAEHQIPSADLLVQKDPHDGHRLQLVRRSDGKRVVPVDLGFLNPRMRPYLFQMLSRFTPVMSFNWPLPDAPDARHAPEFEGVRHRPRLSYEKGIILARRQWQVNGDGFPRPNRHEKPEDYFFRLQTWRLDLGLPDEVFVRVTVLPAASVPDGEEPTRREKARRPVREHLYKPQYVDFANPILVDLLGRLGDTLDRFVLTFEERLPAAEHLPRHDAERYACEMIFQADFPGGFDD